MTTTAPTAPAAPATEQPLLAGKFKTPAELEAGYKALEAKLGQPKPPAAPEAPSSLAIDPAKPAPPPSTIDDVLARAGLEPATVAAAWNKDGKLGDEHYEALEKIGFPKGIVDAAVAGLASQAKAATKTRQEAIAGAIQIAGGEQQLRNMMEWAKTNFSPDDIAHFNAQVDGKGATPASIKAGIELLVGRYRSQFGG